MTAGEPTTVTMDREPPDEPPAGGGRRSRWARWAVLLPLATLALILYLVPLPYFVFSPGPARDVIPLIHVEEHPTYPSEGHFLLTSVYFSKASAYDLIVAWIDSSKAV